MTVFFLYECTRLTMKTDFNNLLPQKHPFIKVHNMIRGIFGGANQVLIMVQVRDGDVFNGKTLEKVQWITREVEKIPGVDPNKVRSIASSKLKDFKFSSGAMSITTLMFPDIPKNDSEMLDLKDKIYSNPRYYGQFVSYDSKKTLIQVDFFEEDINYDRVFTDLSRIREKTEDANHIINIAGEPMHLGYINFYSDKVLRVIGYTVLAICLMLYIYYRSKRAIFVPLVSAAASAAWGLGFMALIGFSLDPLIIILPFLIALMTARHSIQLVARYMEEFNKTLDVRVAAENIIETMSIPGLSGITRRRHRHRAHRPCYYPDTCQHGHSLHILVRRHNHHVAHCNAPSPLINPGFGRVYPVLHRSSAMTTSLITASGFWHCSAGGFPPGENGRCSRARLC